jgi:hypothetical protein
MASLDTRFLIQPFFIYYPIPDEKVDMLGKIGLLHFLMTLGDGSFLQKVIFETESKNH